MVGRIDRKLGKYQEKIKRWPRGKLQSRAILSQKFEQAKSACAEKIENKAEKGKDIAHSKKRTETEP